MKTEVELFGKYLIGQKPDSFSVELYERAMNKMNLNSDRKEEKLLRFVLKNEWSLGMIDSGLALFKRNSVIRTKIFILFSILEASPLYSDKFLPRKRSPLYFFVNCWALFRGMIKALVGGLLVKLI